LGRLRSMEISLFAPGSYGPFLGFASARFGEGCQSVAKHHLERSAQHDRKPFQVVHQTWVWRLITVIAVENKRMENKGWNAWEGYLLMRNI